MTQAGSSVVSATITDEADIDACIVSHYMAARGAEAYNNIVAGGANACILHYNDNNEPLRHGDLLLIDSGCELECYASDVTRTFPVNGQFGEEQRQLYAAVLEAQKAAIEACRVGSTFDDVHTVALHGMCKALLQLGLLSGSLEEVLESKSYRRFFMHRTSHWLGLDVHDCGAYSLEEESRPLEPGMVLTVEPGLYVATDDESVPPEWRGIGVRIEDDVHVTDAAPEVLTAAIPKEIDEVEAACRADAVESLV